MLCYTLSICLPRVACGSPAFLFSPVPTRGARGIFRKLPMRGPSSAASSQIAMTLVSSQVLALFLRTHCLPRAPGSCFPLHPSRAWAPKWKEYFWLSDPIFLDQHCNPPLAMLRMSWAIIYHFDTWLYFFTLSTNPRSQDLHFLLLLIRYTYLLPVMEHTCWWQRQHNLPPVAHT